MALQAGQIADLVLAADKHQDPLKWQDLTCDWQQLYAMDQLLVKEKVTLEGGEAIQWQAMMDDSGAAEHAGLYATDVTDTSDVMGQAEIPWRHTKTHWSIERREISMNKNKRRLFNLMKTREAASMISMAKLMEQTWWGTITDDGESPFGIQYWVTHDADGVTGFTGENHGSFASGPGGISRTTYPRWKNFNAQYVAVSKTDFIRKWREAYVKCQWQAPIKGLSQLNRGRWRFENFVPYSLLRQLEDAAEAQNDQLGRDIASMDGVTLFRKTPINYVPYLDAYTTSIPLWMIDWSVFYPVILEGEYFVKTVQSAIHGQHTVTRKFIDLSWNTKCISPRQMALIAKADPALGI